jgi:hypothetical protein
MPIAVNVCTNTGVQFNPGDVHYGHTVTCIHCGRPVNDGHIQRRLLKTEEDIRDETYEDFTGLPRDLFGNLP